MSEAQDPAIDRRIAAIAAELGLQRAVATPLAGGVANRTLRLQDDRHDYVLRLAGASSAGLGASGACEFAMLALAARADLAPAIVLARPEAGFIVMQHITGRVPDCAAMRDTALLARVGAWIARLHALPAPPLPPIDIAARAAGYLEELLARQPAPGITAIARRLAARRAALGPVIRLVACHHDLHHRNFVDTGATLMVVDWEYAGPGDPAADLASCIGYHSLGPAQVDALLAGYGEDSSALRTRLAALGWVFDCLWFGWNGIAVRAGLAVDRDLQSRLAARLAT